MQRSDTVEQLVMQWFASASAGDTSTVDALVSPHEGVCLIGSDPDEWFHGGNAVAAFLRGEVTDAGGRATFTPADIRAFEESTVGWVTARLTITLTDGRQVSPRWSAVLHREGDVWRFVQTHASIGVDNNSIGWTYPG